MLCLIRSRLGANNAVVKAPTVKLSVHQSKVGISGDFQNKEDDCAARQPPSNNHKLIDRLGHTVRAACRLVLVDVEQFAIFLALFADTPSL